MPRRALAFLLIGLLGAALGLGLAWESGLFGRPAPPPSAIGGPFTLVDQDGRTVNEHALRGRWSAVFFGYANCPDICPTTLHALSEAGDLLGPKAKDLRVVFVTVDPARDTPAVLKAYLQAAGLPDALGLSGTPDQVAAAARAYKVYYKKAGEGDAYQMDHSTAVYLMDPKGRFDRVLRYNESPAEFAADIKSAMSGA